MTSYNGFAISKRVKSNHKNRPTTILKLQNETLMITKSETCDALFTISEKSNFFACQTAWKPSGTLAIPYQVGDRIHTIV